MAVTRILTTSLVATLLVAAGLAPGPGDGAPAAAAPPAVVGQHVSVPPAGEDAGPGRLPDLTSADAEAIRRHTAQALTARPAPEAVDTQGPAAVHPRVTRHSGGDRYQTAAELANTKWRDTIWADDGGEPFPFDKVVFIASGLDYPDALPGGALAAYYGGPLLLTRPDRLPGPTRKALEGLDPDYIAVLGGSSAVSNDVIWELGEFVPAPSRVVRYGGLNRFEVSANVARTIFGHGFGRRAYVALGTDWPDGLSGAAAAGWDRAPLLLTRKASVPGPVMQTLTEFRPEEIIVLGGTVAVSDAVVNQLRAVAPVVRVGGGDRFAVAANVSRLHPTRFGATVASGLNWPDALAGSAYAGLVGDKLLLLRPTGVPGPTRQAVVDQSLALVDALGGPTAIPEPVLTELRSLTVRKPG